jgi:hypothetical protein
LAAKPYRQLHTNSGGDSFPPVKIQKKKTILDATPNKNIQSLSGNKHQPHQPIMLPNKNMHQVIHIQQRIM